MRYIFISTTSKHKLDFLELPQKNILNQSCRNVLISNKEKLIDFLNENAADDITFVIDCEQKQGISLYDIAKDNSNFKCIPYKPNDITLEAADLSVLNYFNNSISGLNIGVYGTGNIAAKLAMRFAERNANVFLLGRNIEKVKVVQELVNQTTFNQSNIKIMSEDIKLNGLISFVSANEVIDEKYLKYLSPNALCLDGGIGNFSKGFISKGNPIGYEIRRIDVRMGDKILEGHINSLTDNPFHQYIGRKVVNEDITIVGGGIIGKENDVIIDNISNPKTVIGLADGFGGVKRIDSLNEIENERIQKINEYIRENH